MHIQDCEIRRVINDEKEYRFGRIMDISKLLERMTISLDESHQCVRVNARVVDNHNKYVTSMKIDANGEIIQYSCTCGKDGCRHEAAILLYLRKQNIDHYPYFYEKAPEVSKYEQLQQIEENRKQRILTKKQQEAKDLISLYKDQLVRDSLVPLSSKQYKLKTYVKQENDHLVMTFRVINGMQGYIVKNIETFLNAINHHENLKYGKNFEFIHSLDAFDEDSNEIISFMKRCILKNQLIQNGIIKSLMTSDEHIDEFYDLMNSLPSSYCDIGFDKRHEQIPLELRQEDHNYILDFKEYHMIENMMMSASYIYSLENDILYRYEFHEPAKVLTFIQKLMDIRGGLYISEESLNDFYKYIFVDLIDDLSLNTNVFNDYHQENMINLYGDMTNEGQICLQIEYIYDDDLAYGFDDNEHKSKEADLIENYLKPYIEDIDDHIIYLQYDHEFSYQFIKEGLPYLSNYCTIYVSDALKDISKNQPLDIQVGVRISNGLLSIQIDSINVQKEELMDILKAYKKKRKFYKLKDGKILSLENQELSELDALTSSLQLKNQDFTNGEIQVPAYRLFELDNIMSQDSSLHFSRSQQFDQWLNDLSLKQSQFEIPQKYEDILREYQIEGYQWLRLMEQYGFGGILADDMGLGKTLQMIVYFEALKDAGTHLVITPASLLLNWADEIEKFSDDLKYLCIYGTKAKREELIQTMGDYQIVITSYDYMRRDVDLYQNFQFHTLVIDEAQYIKNPKTRNALTVKMLKAKQRFALTGTPIENSLSELWSIFDFLMPYYLYNYHYFMNNFEKPIVNSQDEEKQSQLKNMISPFVLRRNKKDVLAQLPEKIEQTLYLQFNEEEEKLYLASLVQANQSLREKLNMQHLGQIEILALLTRLRQLCQDPRLLYEDIDEPSSKMKGCMELIHSLENSHKKILLFSSFTSVLELLEEQCQKEHVSYYLLDGSVSKTKRKQMIDAFQKDDTTLFLISLKAGGSGINLTSAQAVIHYDPWWNMSAKNQATDRAYRIGQNQNVQVFSLIMKNTIEEKIMDLQSQKKDLADTFVEGNEGSLSSMSLDDIKALFAIEGE
ncbi:MAG: SNF2-related protein [Erysipelotrichaceae bacterium]|nr:SNF2-related protein [Erysipelotrichaceae bacterium]